MKKTITLTINPFILAEIENIANIEKRSRSSMIEIALSEFIERQRIDKGDIH